MYTLGTTIKVNAFFTDETGEQVDPLVVTFKVRDPSGNETAYVYGIDAGVVKDDAGAYHFDLLLSAASVWNVRSIGEGPSDYRATQETAFRVHESAFTNP